MIIRNAKIEDTKKIREISIALTIDRCEKQKTGFVEYKTPNEESLINRIIGNKFFYIAERDSDIVGFLSAYKDQRLRKIDFNDDEIVQYLLRNKPSPIYSDDSSFIYADQLAVVREHQNKIIGNNLLKHLIKEATNLGYPKMYGTVSHSPHRNDASIRLLHSLGWILNEEQFFYDGLIFGVYEKKL